MPRLVRDRLTWLIYAQLGLYAYFLYAFGPVVAFLRDEQGTSNALASLHSTAMAVGAMAGGSLFALVARRIGRGRVMWVALCVIASAVALLVILPSKYPVTLTLIGVIAFGGMWVISVVVTSLTHMHGAAGPAAISEANALAVGAGVIAPLVIGLTVAAGLGWRAGMSVLIGLTGLVAVFAWRLRISSAAADTEAPDSLTRRAAANRVGDATMNDASPATSVNVSGAGVNDASLAASAGVSGARAPEAGLPGSGTVRRARLKHAPLPMAYWLAWTMIVMTGAVEIGLSLWTPIVLRERLDFSPAAASAAVSAMVGGMLIGRIIGARLALRYRTIPLYLVALFVSAAGFAMFWLAPGGTAAVVGLFVVGLGNAMHYPLAIALAIGLVPEQADRAAGISSYGMGISFGIGPFALGLFADRAGAHTALSVVPILLAAAGLLAWKLRILTDAPKVDDRPAEVLEQVA